MTLGRNLLVGIASSIWGALLSLAAVPIYLKYLGVNTYGLIGFLATTQGLLQILDLGLAPAVNREIARARSIGNPQNARTLVRTLSPIYWSVGFGIAIANYALAKFISTHWIHSEGLSPETIRQALVLMGIIIAIRWPAALYLSAINGSQRLAASSAISAFVSTFGTTGSILLLIFVSRTIQAFFIWQIVVAILNVYVMRFFAWRFLGKSSTQKFDAGMLKSIWRFSAGMSAIAAMGAVFMQMDKVLLSKLLDLSAFAEYMLAATAASALNLIISPVYNVLYPRFSGLVARGKIDELIASYRVALRGFSSLIFSVALIFAALSRDVIEIWTGNDGITAKVAPIASLLAIGTALNGAMIVPHALHLAFGLTKLPLVINSILLLIMAPVIIALVYFYGGFGGAIAWVVLNFLYSIMSLWLTHLKVLGARKNNVIFSDVAIPLALASVAGLTTSWFFRNDLNTPIYAQLTCGAILGLMAMITSVITFSPCRTLVLQVVRWRP